MKTLLNLSIFRRLIDFVFGKVKRAILLRIAVALGALVLAVALFVGVSVLIFMAGQAALG